MPVSTAQALQTQINCADGECIVTFGGSFMGTKCRCLYDFNDEWIPHVGNKERMRCTPQTLPRGDARLCTETARILADNYISSQKAPERARAEEARRKEEFEQQRALVERQQAEEQAKQKAEAEQRQQEQEKAAKLWEEEQAKRKAEAARPENQIKTANANYIEVKRCYESREGYAEVFINDAELSRAKDMVAGLEQKLKDSSMDLDALWTEANAKAFTPNTMLGPLYGLGCKTAFNALSQHYLTLFPEAATTEKDF